MSYTNADSKDVRADAARYLRAHNFLLLLRECRNRLDRQQISTLRGQALSGDVKGAQKGLERIIREGNANGAP